MNRKLLLIGLALLGAGNTLHWSSKSAFLARYVPSVSTMLIAAAPLALVLIIVGAFLIGWSLYGIPSLIATILGVAFAVTFWLIVFWTPGGAFV